MNKYCFMLLLSCVSAFADEPEWKRIYPGVEFSFPRDHGSHPDTQTEWWYVTGQGTDEQGKEIGYQFTIFRFGIIHEDEQEDSDTLQPNHLLMGHMAVADISNQSFYKAERIRRAGAGFAGASEEKMYSWIGDWEIDQDETGTITIKATAREEGISLNLTLNPLKKPVFHGKDGYSQKGEEVGNASVYYSYTRIQTSGTITIEGTEHQFTGTSWFDHEYGSSQLGEGVAGWDWWGIHLDDGSELMLYQLRYKEGGAIPQSSATLVKPSGEDIQFNKEDWILTPLSFWESKRTGGKYPVEWELKIPKHNININLQAKLNNTEMVTDRSTGVTYWEGPVAVTGSHTGSGYMELTGYAGIFNNTF